MSYYVHVFHRGQKRRMDIDPEKGLGKYISNQHILEKRIRIKDGQEFQELLNQQAQFAILKFDPHRFRWKTMIIFDHNNAQVQQQDLVINGNPKPLKLAGLLDTDPYNLDVLTIYARKPARHLVVVSKQELPQPPAFDEEDESEYYVHIFSRGQKRRLNIHLKRGLGNFLTCNKILERRVLVESPEDVQELLEQGHKFAILKFDPLRFRWKSLILFDQHNAHIEKDELVINDTSKPLHQSGLMDVDPANLNIITIFHLEQLHPTQKKPSQIHTPTPKRAVG
ncbi:MAG: hypothetical protein CL920_11030 [Deltaproteobacteria bacterium]|nr:hypothetical protein [Deltaproteobacteria bacterium]